MDKKRKWKENNKKKIRHFLTLYVIKINSYMYNRE